jgi:transposase
MGTINNFIGIDISKKWLDVSILKGREITPVLEKRYSNSTYDLRLLQKDIYSLNVRFSKQTLVICEHTGIYKKTLVDYFSKQRCLLCVEVAQRIKKSMGIQRGKSDKLDARRIAQYGMLFHQKLSFWKSPRKQLVKIKDLLVNRERILDAKTGLEHALNEFKQVYSKRQWKYYYDFNKPALDGLSASLQSLNVELQYLIDSDREIARRVSLLNSIPGIGTVTSLSLLCATNEFSLCCNGNQLACYVGVAPFEYTSGTSVKGKSRVSHIANKKLKAMLHMAAMSVIRNKKSELGKFYAKKVSEGKSKMLVINAIRRKIVMRVAAVMQRGTPYVSPVKLRKDRRTLYLAPNYNREIKNGGDQ